MPLLGPHLPSPGLFPGGAGPFTDQLLASFAPWLEHDPGGHLYNLLVAKAQMAEQVFAIVQDVGSPDDPANFVAGWSVLLDPDNCPAWALPYCGQFVGVTIPQGTPEADARALIKQETGFKRGTPGALISAAQRFLTGTKSVSLLERTPNPYSVTMVMRPEQVIDQTQLQNAVLAGKPAGIIIIFVYTDAFIWNQAINTWSADTMTWTATASQQP